MVVVAFVFNLIIGFMFASIVYMLAAIGYMVAPKRIKTKISTDRISFQKLTLPLMLGIALPLTAYPVLLSAFGPPPPQLASVTPGNFAIKNYSAKSSKELQKALEKIFPIGTPKSFVDEIIANKEETKCTPYEWEGNIIIRCVHRDLYESCAPFAGTPLLEAIFYYDKKLKLTSVHADEFPLSCKYP